MKTTLFTSLFLILTTSLSSQAATSVKLACEGDGLKLTTTLPLQNAENIKAKATLSDGEDSKEIDLDILKLVDMTEGQFTTQRTVVIQAYSTAENLSAWVVASMGQRETTYPKNNFNHKRQLIGGCTVELADDSAE